VAIATLGQGAVGELERQQLNRMARSSESFLPFIFSFARIWPGLFFVERNFNYTFAHMRKSEKSLACHGQEIQISSTDGISPVRARSPPPPPISAYLAKRPLRNLLFTLAPSHFIGVVVVPFAGPWLMATGHFIPFFAGNKNIFFFGHKIMNNMKKNTCSLPLFLALLWKTENALSARFPLFITFLPPQRTGQRDN